ncbi:DUF3558 family protein [Paractinoplanes rishiriensis]|uniref:DUF3558 domain-containing protein n=1 Tax=Paractinoplanes rishiriensis TaxID=1050105 RepID=A0A919JTT7_9ACTN|nr:DUF3558 family protein [Actinoplanes rishiriensis]GIE93184.1 hypothetical protein Ari01nite_06490 [Actinoplanes rishiriensis]
MKRHPSVPSTTHPTPHTHPRDPHATPPRDHAVAALLPPPVSARHALLPPPVSAQRAPLAARVGVHIAPLPARVGVHIAPLAAGDGVHIAPLPARDRILAAPLRACDRPAAPSAVAGHAAAPRRSGARGRAGRLAGGARALVVAGVAVVALGGCGMVGAGGDGNGAAAATPTATGAAGGAKEESAVSGFGSVKESGDIPDPCTLLSESDVARLTGRDVTQVDRDGADDGEATRYCQWQQDGGQLALFLSRTTKADFDAQIADAEPVDGVGEDAFFQAGHLYVLFGSVQIDVYSRGGADDAANLADAKKVAKAVIAKI